MFETAKLAKNHNARLNNSLHLFSISNELSDIIGKIDVNESSIMKRTIVSYLFYKSFSIVALIIALSSTTYSQSFWSLGKAAHLTSSIGSGLSSGFAQHNETLKYQSNDKHLYYDKLYHNYQTAERTLFIATGLSIPISSEFKPFRTASDILLSVTCQAVFKSIGQNLARNKPMFWKPEGQNSKFAGAEYQIGAFVSVLAINYIIYTFLNE